MFIIIAVLLLISCAEINHGHCSTADESGTHSDISIESENTWAFWGITLVFLNNDMKTNVMIKLVTHKQEEEMLHTRTEDGEHLKLLK